MLAPFVAALIGMHTLTPVHITTPLLPPEVTIESEIVSDPRVREKLWTLLRDAFYGHAKMEEAAFVIRNEDGELGIVRWPSAGVPNEARWRGSFPKGTVAIAHTHPNGFPEPSRADERTARLRKVPVYVLTRLKITKTTGGRSITILKGDWNPAKIAKGSGFFNFQFSIPTSQWDRNPEP